MHVFEFLAPMFIVAVLAFFLFKIYTVVSVNKLKSKIIDRSLDPINYKELVKVAMDDFEFKFNTLKLGIVFIVIGIATLIVRFMDYEETQAMAVYFISVGIALVAMNFVKND